MDKVPYEVLDHAITSAIQARDEVIARNRERENHQPYHILHFVSKKDDRQTITIRWQYCRESLRFYTRLLHNKTILADDPNHPRYKGPDKPPFHHEHQRCNHGWPNENGNVTMDSKLKYQRKLGHWTFVWVYGKSIRENQAEKIHVAAIDPGVRTFLTWYSPTVGYGNIGDNDINRIVRLCLSLDTLILRTTRALAMKRNSMKRAQARLRKHIQNLVDEIHKKAALWLARTFDIIILPTFNSTQMSRRRRGRRLSNRTVRKMMTWAHARFRKRLVSKMEEFDKVVITSVSEAYTSKTCSNCGYIKRNLGGNKEFRCDECGLRINRDLNGAWGIFLWHCLMEP